MVIGSGFFFGKVCKDCVIVNDVVLEDFDKGCIFVSVYVFEDFGYVFLICVDGVCNEMCVCV